MPYCTAPVGSILVIRIIYQFNILPVEGSIIPPAQETEALLEGLRLGRDLEVLHENGSLQAGDSSVGLRASFGGVEGMSGIMRSREGGPETSTHTSLWLHLLLAS